MKIHLTARDLGRLFKPVLPCAGSDDMLPILTAVHLRSSKGQLVAETTDRFRAALNRLEPKMLVKTDPGDDTRKAYRAAGAPDDDETLAVVPDGVDLLLSAHHVRTLVGLFASRRRSVLETVIEVEWDQQTPVGRYDNVWSTEVTFRTLSPVELENDARRIEFVVDSMAGQFPKIEKLIYDVLAYDGERTGVNGFNPKLLSTSFAAAAAVYKTETAVMELLFTAPGKSMGVVIGDKFVGILMPRRLIDSPASRAEPSANVGVMASFLQP